MLKRRYTDSAFLKLLAISFNKPKELGMNREKAYSFRAYPLFGLITAAYVRLLSV